jgi:hypothetical protein
VQPGLEERWRTTYALRHSGSEGCTGASLPRLRNEPWIPGRPGVHAHPSRRGPQGKVICQSGQSQITSFVFLSHCAIERFPHVGATTNKKPGALARSGPVGKRVFRPQQSPAGKRTPSSPFSRRSHTGRCLRICRVGRCESRIEACRFIGCSITRARIVGRCHHEVKPHERSISNYRARFGRCPDPNGIRMSRRSDPDLSTGIRTGDLEYEAA